MHGCEPRNFLQPCLLLLLLDGPAHGYDLIRRLTPYEVTHDDPGHVYRGLRLLEREGLVSSAWAPSDSGPARRVYDITPHGRAALGEWVPELQHLQHLVERYLADYAARQTPRQPANQAPPSQRAMGLPTVHPLARPTGSRRAVAR
jgi:poly-beta-hydroxybutyrate-responsive repressor